MFVVSNIEAIQSQLKDIYTNTLSTLCPLPWLEEAGDVQYNFDDVFIPLRTIDIDIQQRTGDLSGPSDSGDDQEQTSDLSGPSGSRDDEEQTGDLSGPSDSSDHELTSDLSEPSDNSDDKLTSDLSEPSDSSDDEEQTGDLSGPSGSRDDEQQTVGLSGPPGSRDEQVQASKPYRQRNKHHKKRKIDDLSGSSDKRHKKMKFTDQLEPFGKTGLHDQTRYKYDDVRLLYIHFIIHIG